MTDYYRLLNIEPTASTEEIQTAIKKVRRLWNTRSTNPNADIRAEAEQCIRDIAQAEKILLDSSERDKYDIELSQKANETPAITNQEDYKDGTWIDKADYYRKRGDYYSLITLAQGVVSSRPQDHFAWYVLGDAHYHQGNISEAEKCLWQSIRISPTDMAYEILGFIYLDNDQLNDAYQHFAKAAELDPETAIYKLECAETLRLLNRHEEALDLAQKAYKQNPDAGSAQSVYFSCLRDRIYSAVSYNRSSGRHIITNKRQLDFVKQYLPKLANLVSKGNEDQARVESELRQTVIAAEERKYDDHYGSAIWWISGMILSILILKGLGIVLAIGIGAAFYATHFKSGMAWNYLNSSEEIRKSGLK